MLNPLMKSQIGDLSVDSQSAIKTMSDELNATKNLLAKCDNHLNKMKDLGKQLGKVVHSANTEHNQVKLNTKNIKMVAESMSDTHFDKVNPAAQIIFNESQDLMQMTYYESVDQHLQQDRSDLVNAARELCQLTELAVAKNRKDLDITFNKLELQRSNNPLAIASLDQSAIQESPSKHHAQQDQEALLYQVI